MKVKYLLHLLDAAFDTPGPGGVVRPNALDQGPGQHISRGTFNTNRRHDLSKVNFRMRIGLGKAYNCTVALGRFMVLLNELLDPRCFSGSAGFKLVAVMTS